MQKSQDVTCTINTSAVIQRLKTLKQRAQRVYVVLKHSSYGTAPPAEWMDKLHGECDGFYFSNMQEAMEAARRQMGRNVIAVLDDMVDLEEVKQLGIRPIIGWKHVMSFEEFEDAIVLLDVGIGRDGVPMEFLLQPDKFTEQVNLLERVTRHVYEVMWTARDKHDVEVVQRALATSSNQLVQTLAQRWQIRHAAATSLVDLNDDSVLLNGIRVGLSLFRDVVTVCTRVSFVSPDVYAGKYEIGYRKTLVNHHFTLPIGYAHSHCIRPGQPLVVESGDKLIDATVIEVGMGTSVASCDEKVMQGSVVRLLHPERPTLSDVARAWKSTPQQALLMMTSAAGTKK